MNEKRKNVAKQVIVEIIHQFGGHLEGPRRLHQAFYFAHLFLFEECGGLLTDWPMVKDASGPVIEQVDDLMGELVKEGMLSLEPHMVGPFPTSRYGLTGKSTPSLREEDTAAITRALDFIKPKSDADLYQTIVEYSRSWRTAKIGETLNVFTDVIPDEEYWQCQKDLALIEEQMIQAGFGQTRMSPR